LVVSVTVKVATPALSVTWVAGLMTDFPLPWSNETVLPETLFPKWSLSVTVICADVFPSAGTEDGSRPRRTGIRRSSRREGHGQRLRGDEGHVVRDVRDGERDGLGLGVEHLELGHPLLSVAPATVPPAGTIGVTSTFTSDVVGVTDIRVLGRTWSAEFRMVTVKLAEDVPSAGSVVGVMLTEERVGDGVGAAGAEKVTVAMVANVVPSLVSTAVKCDVSAAVSVTMKLASPLASVTTGWSG